jgi:hypothetical protein
MGPLRARRADREIADRGVGLLHSRQSPSLRTAIVGDIFLGVGRVVPGDPGPVFDIHLHSFAATVDRHQEATSSCLQALRHAGLLRG